MPPSTPQPASRSPKMYHRFYRSLYRIRRVEQEIARVYPLDKIKSPVHLSIGQEAVSVGVCEALRPEDIVFGTYRGHALYLAKGGDLRRMIAELYGKQTGCARGKGGSMHLVDVQHGVMGTSAVVGTTIPNAVGYAFAMEYQRKNSIVVSFFGDGATEEGVFHESLNFAALKKLPVIFICENNGYAIHSPLASRQPAENIVERVKSFGVPAERIGENDVLAIHERVSKAANAIRLERSGPVFFECMTYRWMEHVGPYEDFDLGYRQRSEAQTWVTNDQVQRLGGMIPADDRKAIENEIETEIQDAFMYAESCAFPGDADLHVNVFREE